MDNLSDNGNKDKLKLNKANSNDQNKTNKSTKSNKPNEPENNSFREFIKSTGNFKEYNQDKYNPFENKDRDRTSSEALLPRSKPLLVEDQELHFQLSEHLWRPAIDAEDYLFYFQSGVQYKTIRKLRAGKIRIEDILDLHQMNKEQARIAFANFIIKSFNQEKRCIQIIHGKGIRSGTNNPILKNLVNHWLHDINIVLGFCSCPEHLGGTGAVLVLLKRSSN